MPEWKRIIVGDAFRLPSRNPRYYLDVALVFPLAVAFFFFVDSIHGWHVSSWNVRQAAFSGLLVCVFLLLIKDIIRVIAEILSFLTFVLGWRFAFHSDLTAFGYALVCVLGIPLIIILGVLFRIYVLKKPGYDPTYYSPDRSTTPLGVFLVLGLLISFGVVGIYLSWK